jgi:hypothetical protein
MTRFDDLPYDVVLAMTKLVAADAGETGAERTLAYMACTSRMLRKSVDECTCMIDVYDPLVTRHMAKALMREVYDFRDMLATTPPGKLEAAAVARGYAAKYHGCLQDFTVLGKSFDKYVTPRVHVYIDPVYIDEQWNFGSSVWVSFFAFQHGTYKWIRLQISGPGTYVPGYTSLARVRDMLTCKPFGAKR